MNTKPRKKTKWFLPALIVAGLTCSIVIVGVVGGWRTLTISIPLVILLGMALVAMSQGHEVF